MTDLAIRVENLSKQYCIGKRERYRTLRYTLADAVSAPFHLLKTALGTKVWGVEKTAYGDNLWASLPPDIPSPLVGEG